MDKIKGYILIDTNLYEGLFIGEDFHDRIFPLLEKITSTGYILLLPQQIIDELSRNRYGAWVRKRNNTKIQKLEKSKEFLEGLNYDELTYQDRFINQIDKLIKKLEKEDIRIYENVTSRRGTQSISKLHKLSIVVEDSIEIMQKVLYRELKGNPPFDKGQSNEGKSCDRCIWESVLSYFELGKIKKPNLLFYTKNINDWCVEDKNSNSILNPFLVEEFKVRTKGKITWFDSLHDLPNITNVQKIAVEKAEKEFNEANKLRNIEERIADKLRNSNTWERTNFLINYINSYISKFSADTIEQILRASIDNDSFSGGPYNQVLDNTSSLDFFTKIYSRSKELKMKKNIWKKFYISMDKGQQEAYFPLRKMMMKDGISFEISDLKFIHNTDIPF